MSLLSSISGPRDLDALSLEQLEELAARDPRIPDRERVAHGRSPRSEPRRRRAHDRDAPRVRLAQRPDHLRHRAPVVRPQAPHRASGLHRTALARRPRRLSAALGEPARRRGVLACVQLAQLGRRHLARSHPHGPQGPARRRRRRRRRADRRHDVGGAQQHLRRQQPQPRHRRQRQRPLVRPDDRRHGALPEPGAHRRHAIARSTAAPIVLRQARACVARDLPRRPRRHPRLPVAGSPTTPRCTPTSTSSTWARSTATTCRC